MTMMIEMMTLMVPADTVVRRRGGRVPDSRKLDPEYVVHHPRQYAVRRDDVGDSSRIHRRLHDVVRRRSSVHLRRNDGHVNELLHQRTTHDLLLQSHGRPRRRNDQLSDETAQEMARHLQTQTGLLYCIVLYCIKIYILHKHRHCCHLQHSTESSKRIN